MMNESEARELLDGLIATDTGWTASIPTEAGQFLGHALGFDLQTRHARKDGPPPQPDETRLALARQVLTALPQVLATAEREYAAYADAEVDAAVVANPHIWLALDAYEEDGPERWSLVIERKDWPDYGVHVEFDGLEFLEAWGGD